MSDYISEYVVTDGWPQLRKGCTGKPQELTQGGTQATGSIQFSANPTSADTIVLNGTTVTFGTDVTVGVDLATTLASLTTFLNGSADANLAVATYTDNTTDTLTITFDVNGTSGNSYTIVTTGLTAAPTAADTALSGGQDTPAISLDTENVSISLTQAVDQDFTLADGAPFQRKTIVMAAKGSTGNAVITPTNFTDGTTITLDTVNDYVELQFIVDAWKVVGTSVATIA